MYGPQRDCEGGSLVEKTSLRKKSPPPRLALGTNGYGYNKTALKVRLGQLETFKRLDSDCDTA